MRSWMSMLLVLLSLLTACRQAPPPLDPGETQDPAAILELVSGGETILPYEHFCWSKSWDIRDGEGGWLHADAPYFGDKLSDVYAELPTVYTANGMEVRYGRGVSHHGVSVFREDFEKLPFEGSVSDLLTLEPGTYYVGIYVFRKGTYIPEAQDWNTAGYDCAFRLIVE